MLRSRDLRDAIPIKRPKMVGRLPLEWIDSWCSKSRRSERSEEPLDWLFRGNTEILRCAQDDGSLVTESVNPLLNLSSFHG